MSKYLETKLGKDVITYIYRIIHKRNMKDVNCQYLSNFKFHDYNNYLMVMVKNKKFNFVYAINYRISWLWKFHHSICRFIENKWMEEHDGNNVIMLPNNY
jgi:hypothetical protein